ncbi:MAG: M3 family metallopeptidase, partial [Bacteroidales bacterium]
MYRTLIAFLILALASLTSCTNEPKKERVMDPLNPFFNQYETPFEVPPFDQIKPEHYLPAFEEGMAQQKEAVEAILASKKKPTFRNTLEALDQSGELLSRVSSVFYGLSSANTNEDLQKIQLEISPKMAAHSDEINLNPNLFKRIKSVYDNREKMKLTEEQAYILENKYKELVRNGANLPDDKKEELKQINQELSILGVQFSQNVLEETNAFSLVIDHPADLKGLSQTSVDAAAEAAAEAGMPGKWVFTAQKPSWIPFLQSAHNRELRKELYAGWLNRGNRNNEYDNKEILAKMMALRAQKAHLLGYASHADLVMESRMAKTPENVMALLDQVWKPALAAAIRDRDQMQEIIRREGGRFQLEAHDWWMYAEKLRKEQFDLDESELRPYFKLENVSRGVFDVANKLYGITFTEITDIPKPHSEAVAYEVKEADGSHLGVLYMDFHPRASKRQGAWCGGYRGHHVKDGQEITPVVTIVCNFTRPSGNQPALLSPDEVETLFHEFGHG